MKSSIELIRGRIAFSWFISSMTGISDLVNRGESVISKQITKKYLLFKFSPITIQHIFLINLIYGPYIEKIPRDKNSK
jgi:hypothetical protein